MSKLQAKQDCCLTEVLGDASTQVFERLYPEAFRCAISVGTFITERPPHREQGGCLTALLWPWMKNSGLGRQSAASLSIGSHVILDFRLRRLSDFSHTLAYIPYGNDFSANPQLV